MTTIDVRDPPCHCWYDGPPCPRHPSPRHRNDRPVDACSLVVMERFRSENACTTANGGACADYPPRHAARVAADEQGAS